MEETGVVKSIEGPFARVFVEKKGVCEKCTAGVCHLADDGAELEALNNAGAEVGQRVRVVLRPYSYLKGSFIVYGLPALALIVGAVIGREISGSFKDTDPDLLSAIFAFGAFGLSLIAVKLWSMRAEKKTEYRPVIEEILNTHSERN